MITLFLYKNLNTGVTQGGQCGISQIDDFFRISMNCVGTENTIEECGEVVELDSCSPCNPSTQAYGWLQCQPGKSLQNHLTLDFNLLASHLHYQSMGNRYCATSF